jgi:uncharacterized protein (DUF2267 family)
MDKLKGGGSQPPDFAGSMAAAIEAELNKLLADDLKQQLPTDGTKDEAKDRRRFLAAIARGVIRHLKENPDALQVVFTQVPNPHVIGDFEARVQVNATDV